MPLEQSRLDMHGAAPADPVIDGHTRAPSTPPGAIDEKLGDCVRRMAHGDQGALAEIYDATADRVYSVALLFVRDAHAAEEVVSDVYFQAWKEANRYDLNRGSVRTWLLMLCRSRALDSLRRREAPHVRVDPEEIDHSHVGDMASGADVLESIERRSALHQALYSLEPLQRQLVSLSFFRGYSHAEIALREGMPLGSVKTHIRSALCALRTALFEFRE